MTRKTVPISLSVFWSFLCTKSIYKTHESPNIHFEKIDYSPNSVLRQYPLESTEKRKNDICKGSTDFSIAESGIYNKYKKICSSTLPIIENSKEITLLLPQEKVTVIIQQCQTFLSRDQVSVGEISQLMGKLCYSAIALLSAPLYDRSLQRQQILEFSVYQVLEASVCLSSDGVSLVGQQPENEQCGSSHPEVFCRKGVLRNFAKFTGKHLCQSLFFN